jgi:hypothetical protein
MRGFFFVDDDPASLPFFVFLIKRPSFEHGCRDVCSLGNKKGRRWRIGG